MAIKIKKYIWAVILCMLTWKHLWELKLGVNNNLFLYSTGRNMPGNILATLQHENEVHFFNKLRGATLTLKFVKQLVAEEQ